MRIVWTKDEKRALLESMIDIIAFSPKLSNKEILRRAQEDVIPPDRRTKITDQRVFNYKGLIGQARDAVALAAKNPPRPRPLPVNLEPPAPEPRKVDTLGDVFELLVDAIADRIMDKLAARQPAEGPAPKVEQTQPILERGWLDAHLEKLTIRKPPVKKRPTVLVVGLNGCQMEAIRNYKPDLDYTFVTAEQALSHYAFNKDHTILMTKFINHSVQNKYRKHPNLHYCNGGVSELKHMLQVIFHKETV